MTDSAALLVAADAVLTACGQVISLSLACFNRRGVLPHTLCTISENGTGGTSEKVRCADTSMPMYLGLTECQQESAHFYEIGHCTAFGPCSSRNMTPTSFLVCFERSLLMYVCQISCSGVFSLVIAAEMDMPPRPLCM